MSKYLFEGQASIYVLLGLATIICAVLWSRSRSRAWLFIVVGFAALLVGYFALDQLVETDRERAELTFNSIVQQVNEHNVTGLFSQISEDFDYRGRDKKQLRQLAERYLKGNARIGVSNVKVTKVDEEKGTATIAFQVKIEARGSMSLNGGEMELKREASNQWRMTTFRLFKPGSNEEVSLPGL